MILKLILDLSIGANLSNFITGIQIPLLARNREKFQLVEAFVVSNNIEIFCISEAFLDSSVDDIYDRLNMIGYTLVRNDHPSNTKRVV